MIRISILIIIILQTSNASAQQVTQERKHIIAGGELTSLFNEEGTTDSDGNVNRGAYYKLLSEVLISTGLDKNYQLRTFPLERAKHGFMRERYACFCPGIETLSRPEIELNELKILSSQPINKAIVRVVSKQSSNVVGQVDDIRKSDAISIVRGVPMNADILSMLSRAGMVVEVSSELENLKMLYSGRVNHIIMFHPDAISAYRQLNLSSHYPYDPSFSPMVINDNIICHASHQKTFEMINRQLSAFRESGKTQRILGETYLIGSKYLK